MFLAINISTDEHFPFALASISWELCVRKKVRVPSDIPVIAYPAMYTNESSTYKTSVESFKKFDFAIIVSKGWSLPRCSLK